MKIVLAPDWSHKWLLDQVGLIASPEIVCIAAVSDDNTEILGMTGLDCWTDNSVQAHICIANPRCARSLVRATLQYAFDNDRKVVVGVTPGDLPRAERFMKGIGFKELCRIKDGNRKGVDTIISEIREENCMWARKPVEEAA